MTGYAIGVVGAIVAVVAIVQGLFPLLLGVAPDRVREQREPAVAVCGGRPLPARSPRTALSTVVWAATVGAIVGPNIVGPSGEVAVALGLPREAGPYLVPIVLVGAAGFLS